MRWIVMAATAAVSLGLHVDELTSLRDPAWVADRVAKWQPTERERRWEQIGWAKDLRDALRLGKQSSRPVFLYTHDGHLAVGRC